MWTQSRPLLTKFAYFYLVYLEMYMYTKVEDSSFTRS